MSVPNKAMIMAAAGTCLLAWSCSENRVDAPTPTTNPTAITDSGLYQLVRGNTFSYYRSQDTLLAGAPTSPHGPFKLRFNGKALTSLNSEGKLPQGAQFQNGAIVLKEFFDGQGALGGYAVMLKSPADTNASDGGWVWGEYFPDGRLIHSVKNDGQGCIHCHRQPPNRDFVLSFDLH